jgi:hypothetical protein
MKEQKQSKGKAVARLGAVNPLKGKSSGKREKTATRLGTVDPLKGQSTGKIEKAPATPPKRNLTDQEINRFLRKLNSADAEQLVSKLPTKVTKLLADRAISWTGMSSGTIEETIKAMPQKAKKLCLRSKEVCDFFLKNNHHTNS